MIQDSAFCGTHLPFFIPRISIVRLWSSSTRHLRFIVLDILLRKRRANLLVCLEVRFLAIFAAVRRCVALVAGLEGSICFAALSAG